MSAATTLDRVRAVTAEHLCHHLDQVSPLRKFKDLDADSIDQIELVMAFEDEFGVKITDDEGAALTGVADTVRLIDRKLAEARDA